MTNKAKSKESTIELHAQAIECRMVSGKLFMKAVNFQADGEDGIGVPRLVIRFDPGVKQIEAVEMLYSVIDRIAGDSLPPVKVAVPSGIVDLIKRRKATRRSISARLRGLPVSVKDSVLTYMDERFGVTPEGEV